MAEVNIFGNRVPFILKDQNQLEAVKGKVTSLCGQMDLNEISPDLEDLFVFLIKEH